MNRRSVLRLLGLAPVAAPVALAVAARTAVAPDPLAGVYGVAGQIEGQAIAFSQLTTRAGGHTSHLGSIQSVAERVVTLEANLSGQATAIDTLRCRIAPEYGRLNCGPNTVHPL